MVRKGGIFFFVIFSLPFMEILTPRQHNETNEFGNAKKTSESYFSKKICTYVGRYN